MDGMRASEPGTASDLPRRLNHPAFAALLSTTAVTFEESLVPSGMVCSAPHRATLSPFLQPSLQSLVTFRLVLELCWLRGIPGLTGDASLLLASRAAAGFLTCLPARHTRNEADEGVIQLISRCADDNPSDADLQTTLSQLQRLGLLTQTAADRSLQPLAVSQARSLWPFARAAEMLIVSGGDDRLSLHGETGCNQYGCSPFPEPSIIDFASSTASSISAEALEVVELARQELLETATHLGETAALEKYSARIRDNILEHFEIKGIGECLLAASGTDAALLTTVLLKAASPDRIVTSIVMGQGETGSGVPHAVVGEHFAHRTVAGVRVQKGQPLSNDLSSLHLHTVAVRQEDGSCRAVEDIDREVELAVAQGLERGSVVLHALQGSKTDLVVPSLQTCVQLAAINRPRLHIVIDACQVRCSPALVKQFIDRNFFVLVTGSKFFGAPGFCGAVLVPLKRARHLMRSEAIPEELSPYATWHEGLIQRRCAGLIMRWTAALYSMGRLKALPEHCIAEFLTQAGEQIRWIAGQDKRLHLVDVQDLSDTIEAQHRSIFTFKIKIRSDFLAIEVLRSIYEHLRQPGDVVDQSDARLDRRPAIRFGQPVQLGEAGAAGFRVAISARHIFDSVEIRPQLVIAFNELSRVLDTL